MIYAKGFSKASSRMKTPITTRGSLNRAYVELIFQDPYTREYNLLEILFFSEKFNLYIPRNTIWIPIEEINRDRWSTRRSTELHFISPFIVAHASNCFGILGKKDWDCLSIWRVTESPFACQVDMIHGLQFKSFGGAGDSLSE